MLSFALFTVGSIWLSAIDLATHRLPNRLVLLNTAALIFSLVLSESMESTKRGLLVAFSYLIIFLILSIFSQGGLGMGDVKYSFSCGLIVGAFARDQWLLVIWVMFVLAAIASMFLFLTKKLARSDRIAFGPYMALATICFVANSLGSGFA